MAERAYLAIDLGASSGRHVLGRFDGQRVALQEVHRFENGPVEVNGTLHWDLFGLWNQILAGLRKAKQESPAEIQSVGVDTWGVDYGLLSPTDELLGMPVHYRDRRTEGILERAFARVPREQIFRHTGLQFMPFNTLFQLWAMRQAGSAVLNAAGRMLLMPDLFHWLLTGEKTNERTNATTTQLYDPQAGNWCDELFAAFDLPRAIAGPITEPGTRIGKLRSHVAEQTGLPNVSVVLPPTHDTASAVLAVPAATFGTARPNWCYISSGTWSLMGAEIDRPMVTADCQRLNFTNEGGVGGTTRLLKNITGLWLVQECRRGWAQSGYHMSWESLAAAAEQAPQLASLIDPDDASFVAPKDMPQAIRAYCRRTGQTVPQDDGAVIRCALESIAMKYRRVLAWLEELLGYELEVVHVVGGGVQNRALCQFTADACAKSVMAGPSEATATGNLLMQVVASREIGSIAEGREVVRRSFTIDQYQPRDTQRWQEAYERFLALSGS